jgi:pilus assembly protein CpaB
MRPARILLLVVAIVAGGLAAYFATRGAPPAPAAVVETAEAPMSQVLIATRSIGIGERLSASSVAWQDWPDTALRPEYMTRDRLPDAPEQMAGTVARFEIFVGEPIREAKLVRTEQGYLSAVIEPGMRAVSVGVSAESGAGGFIVPNDRVDVVLTRNLDGVDVAQTILSNVRVLAIGHRLGEIGSSGDSDSDTPESVVFDGGAIATLELNPIQSETIINATQLGRLALVLRSIVDFADRPSGGDGRSGTSSVKLIRFGQETSITSSMDPVAMETESAQPISFTQQFQPQAFDSTAPVAQ